MLVLCNKLQGFTPRGGRSFEGDHSFRGKPGCPVMCAGGRGGFKASIHRSSFVAAPVSAMWVTGVFLLTLFP